MFTVTFLCCLIVFLLYKYSTRNFNYWKRKGVPHPKPLPFFGNVLEVFTFRLTLGQYLAKLYNDFKETPYFGFYVLNKPCFVLNDRELMKTILISDFNHFCDKNLLSDEASDPVMANAMGMIKNPAWKNVRGKMSAAFSIGKLKHMVKLISEVTDEMINYIEGKLDEECLEVKELTAKLTVDVTAKCLFGVNAHCFQNEDAELLKIAKIMFGFNWRNGFVQSCYFIAPDLAKRLKLPFFDPKVNEFMRKMFWTSLEERKRNNIKRNDLIDIVDHLRSNNKPEDDYQFVGDRVVAQPLAFFSAGFETTRTVLAFTLYELCMNKQVQDKLRKEIQMVLAESNEITYEVLQEMKYMDMVISETLRKFPPLPFVDRTCTKDYTIPNTDIVIEEGTALFVPMLGIHWDPDLYPNPEKFDPERFSDKQKENLSHIPFGIGPRSCIGSRFAVIELKVALTRILSEFEVGRCSKTPVTIQIETKSLLTGSKEALLIKFTRLNK